MKEKPIVEQANVNPTLEELDSNPGREIAGIRPRPEKFLRLKEGADFTVVKKNEHITSDRDMGDFFVFISPSAGTETKTIEAPHWRTITDEGVRAEVRFDSEDESKRDFFYAVNVKGVGYLKPSAKGYPFEEYGTWTIKDEDGGVNDDGYKILGLTSRKESFGNGDLIDKANFFAENGLRTEVYWAIADLNRLPFRGELVATKELKKKRVLSPRIAYQPNQVIRLMKINTRIAEANESSPDRARDMFKRAFDVFNQEGRDKKMGLPELRIGDAQHEKIFFEEFFRRMGGNLAVLLNIGYHNGNMHSANITLAAEIVDVGTVTNQIEEKYSGVGRTSLKDMRDVCYDLRLLLSAAHRIGLETGSRDGLATAFFEGFDGKFSEKEAEEKGTDPKNAKKWLSKIFDRVVTQKGNLPSLKHYEVEDWDISV
ncbi:MAG: hypothetical protein HYT62_00825 [Candidatus Yanofskybacteria bacterium]|nr:hypothetical protein [Candidatus Yanofskybacteria bacterium]